jgi:hypothetical protein
MRYKQIFKNRKVIFKERQNVILSVLDHCNVCLVQKESQIILFKVLDVIHVPEISEHLGV